jgi:pimeloyl-ACP methyl ester carboxylesterase
MRPTLFGSSALPLFGVHHAPTGTPRDVGVVLFYPGLQEYGSAHGVIRSLASALAARGFHAFRFDYRGSGDSAGDPEDATIDAWAEDARAACDEIRDATGVARLTFVGLRLGAAVAALVSATQPGVDGLFLWDPVVLGERYLEDLELLDATRRLRLMHPRRRAVDDGLAGFVFPRRVRDSIAKIDLRGLELARATRIETFVAHPRQDVLAFCEALRQRGVSIDVHFTGEDSGVGQAAGRESALFASRAVAAIVARLEGRT